MQPNNPVAIPTIAIPLDKGSVDLNQPFPKEVANAPLVGVAEQVGQTAVESSLHPEESEAKVQVADKLATKESSTATKNTSGGRTTCPLVKILVIVGIVAVTSGLLLFFVNILLGILIIAIGSLPILFAVFGPTRVLKRQ